MYLSRLRLSSFRSYTDQTITFQPDLTTIMGENNTGKSTIILALSRLIAHLNPATTPQSSYTSDDLPYGQNVPITIEATLELTTSERQALINAVLPPPFDQHPGYEHAYHWIIDQGSSFKLVSTYNPSASNLSAAFLSWGDFIFDRSQTVRLATANPTGTTSVPNPPSFADIFSTNELSSQAYVMQYSPINYLNFRLTQAFKHIQEFRAKSSEERTSAVESPTGEQTASVLLNLRNHSIIAQRNRYRAIQTEFNKLFPRYNVEAVEASPGGGVPLIQFYEGGRDRPVVLRQVSSGVHQILTILTNIIGQEGLIIAIEHPEQHLHPHGLRFLHRLIEDNAKSNQIIVITHDTHFVTGGQVAGFRRVWWTRADGTKVFGIKDEVKQKDFDRFNTVLRQLSNREMLFARCVVLVEDETQQEFIQAIAPTLGFQLDALGISVLAVGSEDGYAPFLSIADALRIPVVCLRDNHWGDASHYPPEQFFSFGMEIEQYLDADGLGEKRAELMRVRGTSERRAAGLLGAQLEQKEIPRLFGELLAKAEAMATGEPTGG